MFTKQIFDDFLKSNATICEVDYTMLSGAPGTQETREGLRYATFIKRTAGKYCTLVTAEVKSMFDLNYVKTLQSYPVFLYGKDPDGPVFTGREFGRSAFSFNPYGYDIPDMLEEWYADRNYASKSNMFNITDAFIQRVLEYVSSPYRSVEEMLRTYVDISMANDTRYLCVDSIAKNLIASDIARIFTDIATGRTNAMVSLSSSQQEEISNSMSITQHVLPAYDAFFASFDSSKHGAECTQAYVEDLFRKWKSVNPLPLDLSSSLARNLCEYIVSKNSVANSDVAGKMKDILQAISCNKDVIHCLNDNKQAITVGITIEVNGNLHTICGSKILLQQIESCFSVSTSVYSSAYNETTKAYERCDLKTDKIMDIRFFCPTRSITSSMKKDPTFKSDMDAELANRNTSEFNPFANLPSVYYVAPDRLSGSSPYIPVSRIHSICLFTKAKKQGSVVIYQV